MLKLLVPLIIVLALAGGGFFLYKNLQKKPVTQPTSIPQVLKNSPQPTPSPITATVDPCEVLTKGSTDIPPLYQEGIIWQQPKITEYEVPLAEGSQKMNGCLITTTQISLDLSDQIRDSYTSELQKRNWELETAGDMPGAGFVTWKKDKSYFILRVNSVGGDLNKKTITLFYTQ